MRILVTRPEDDAAPLAQLLRARGHEIMLEPLLHIRFRDAPLSLAGVQAVLFTSANGVRAAARATPDRDPAAWCVGDASARAARDAGFRTVSSASGDVHALAALVRRLGDPAKGPLVHVAGSEVAGDLAGTLIAAGFDVRRTVLYDSEAAAALSEATLAALRAGRIDAVALFSPRTARTFARLARDAGVDPMFTGVDMLCLSQPVADALGTVPHRHIRVAAEPTQDALIELIA